MHRINLAISAISVGCVLGLYHLAWTILVATATAKPVMDFILRLHFIQLDFAIAPFQVGTAVALIALTSFIGGIIGLVFALVWNWLVGSDGNTG